MVIEKGDTVYKVMHVLHLKPDSDTTTAKQPKRGKVQSVNHEQHTCCVTWDDGETWVERLADIIPSRRQATIATVARQAVQ